LIIKGKGGPKTARLGQLGNGFDREVSKTIKLEIKEVKLIKTRKELVKRTSRNGKKGGEHFCKMAGGGGNTTKKKEKILCEEEGGAGLGGLFDAAPVSTGRIGKSGGGGKDLLPEGLAINTPRQGVIPENVDL